MFDCGAYTRIPNYKTAKPKVTKEACIESVGSMQEVRKISNG